MKKSEKILLAVLLVIFPTSHAFRNASLTKKGFIRSYSRSYEKHAVTNSSNDSSFFARLALAAEQRTSLKVNYDGSYKKIDYPNGDVDKEIGVCTDVVIRSYREFGIDLQELIHLDMKNNFFSYPKMWKKLGPDTNIDHRRVPNQMVFFQRNGAALPITENPKDYTPGDIVAWSFGSGLMHVGIVSTQISNDAPVPLIVHNIGRGPEVSDILFSYPIIGHFKYMGSVFLIVKI